MDLSSLPQIEIILEHSAISRWPEKISLPITVQAVRDTVEAVRSRCTRKKTGVPSFEEIVQRTDAACKEIYRNRIRRVINATGVVLHTNMGRTPINAWTCEQTREVNTGFSNIELNLETGKRGKRNGLIPRLLAALTDAETGIIVNNNAAAVFLILNVFAMDKEVIVSRGEQVQIGGGFRIPEILKLSGAKLVEVGTTNITTVDDYKRALTGDTAVILQVHSSNFAVRGFTKKPTIRELQAVKPKGCILCVDQGSGVTEEDLPGERRVKEYIKNGADLVSFSGDKILGGPQAGCICGNAELIRKLDSHPLMRTFRPGKTIYSLMEGTLINRCNGTPGFSSVCLHLTQEELKQRCRKLTRGIDKSAADITPTTIYIGGGSAPDESFPSYSVRLNLNETPEKVLTFFRESEIPVIGRIIDDQVLLNVSTIFTDDIPYIRSVIEEAVTEFGACT